MTNNSIYNSIIKAKNGTEIPIFEDGKTVDSKYNPEREAEKIISTIDKKNNFFIVIGIASGILISKLKNAFPSAKIIAIEKEKQDIDFLLNLKLISVLIKENDIIFSDINELQNNLINNYIPAKYGNIKIIPQQGWINKNQDCIEKINYIINKSIGIISADYSVQCHFGKIWQNNIINNLKTISTNKVRNQFEIETIKPALILAAGPSLDKNLKKIQLNNYFIISTDTALGVLLKQKISPDIVVSIDGQHISHNHFINSKLLTKTIFVLDLCSDNSIGNYLNKLGKKVSFFISGHPLSAFVNNFSDNKFNNLLSGAGTVTITALDLAFKLGFKSITILGADFSYLKGKSYATGTYFDTIFNLNNNKTESLEKKYLSLLYRTNLKNINKYEETTELLLAYKTSLEKYLGDRKLHFSEKDKVYSIYSKQNTPQISLSSNIFNYKEFQELLKKINIKELEYPLLPYVAWLRNKKKYEKFNFTSLLKLAHSHIVSYN